MDVVKGFGNELIPHDMASKEGKAKLERERGLYVSWKWLLGCTRKVNWKGLYRQNVAWCEMQVKQACWGKFICTLG